MQNGQYTALLDETPCLKPTDLLKSSKSDKEQVRDIKDEFSTYPGFFPHSALLSSAKNEFLNH